MGLRSARIPRCFSDPRRWRGTSWTGRVHMGSWSSHWKMSKEGKSPLEDNYYLFFSCCVISWSSGVLGFLFCLVLLNLHKFSASRYQVSESSLKYPRFKIKESLTIWCPKRRESIMCLSQARGGVLKEGVKWWKKPMHWPGVASFPQTRDGGKYL